MCKGPIYQGKVYNGRNPRMRGQKAMVRIKPSDPTRCYAQFEHFTNHNGWTELRTIDFNFRPSELSEFWAVQGRN